MSISVFLSNDSISAVEGSQSGNSIRVKRAWNGRITEGNIINGLIINEQELGEDILQFWKENNLPNKGVELVVNSSHYTMKELKVPAVGEKKMRECILREFSEVENKENAICDYQLISKDKKAGMNKVLAVMADKELVESHKNLFANQGITLESMRPGRTALLGLCRGAKNMDGKFAIWGVLENSYLHNMLFVDGEYVYASRTRLFNGRGTDGLGIEITQSISGILQFYDTLNREEKISNIYFSGMQPEELAQCREAIDMLERGLEVSGLDVSFVSMPQGISANQYIFPIASLMNREKKVNLIRAQRYSKEKDERTDALIKRLLPLFAVTGILAAATAVLFGINGVKSRQLQELMDYNTNPGNLSIYDESMALETRITSLTATINQLQYFSQAKNSYPAATMTVVRTIENAAADTVEVTVNGYTGTDGSLQFSAQAANSIVINEFIDRLEDTGMFESVEYSGYSMVGEDQQYSINVTCHLAETAGK